MVDKDNKDVAKTEEDEIKYATHEPGKFVTDPHDKEYMEMTLKGGNHSPLVKKILKQRIEARAKEFPRWPSSEGSGVRIMWIESRFWYDRDRLSPDFDDDWRDYRVKYLKSLELDPREPVHIPAYETELLNPLRRYYMKIGDVYESAVLKKVFKLNHWESQTYRVTTARFLMAYVGFMGFYYYIRYTHRKWFDRAGPMMAQSRPIVYPGDPRYPFKDPHTHPAQFNDRGFTKRKIFKDLRDFDTTHYAL